MNYPQLHTQLKKEKFIKYHTTEIIKKLNFTISYHIEYYMKHYELLFLRYKYNLINMNKYLKMYTDIRNKTQQLIITIRLRNSIFKKSVNKIYNFYLNNRKSKINALSPRVHKKRKLINTNYEGRVV